MLYKSSVKLNSFIPDTFEIQGLQEGEYFYVNRNVYDTALIIQYKAGADLNTFFSNNGFELNVPNLAEVYNSLPSPLNVLAGFISLANVPADTPIDDYVGVISYLSSNLDLLGIFNIPVRMRASISFPISSIRKFQEMTESFYKSFSNPVNNAPMFNNSYSSSSKDGPIIVEENGEQIVYTEEIDVDALLEQAGFNDEPLLTMESVLGVETKKDEVSVGDTITEEQDDNAAYASIISSFV